MVLGGRGGGGVYNERCYIIKLGNQSMSSFVVRIPWVKYQIAWSFITKERHH